MSGQADTAALVVGVAVAVGIAGVPVAQHDAAVARRMASVADELSRLAGLMDQGLLTRDEFDALKARLLTG